MIPFLVSESQFQACELSPPFRQVSQADPNLEDLKPKAKDQHPH